MQNRGVWIAFLLVCFLLTGLVGLFASYASSIPLERALYRIAVLDQVLEASHGPDAATRLEALRPALGPNADQILAGTDDVASRVAAARQQARSEGTREAAAVGDRARLMLGVVTLLTAGLGAGILILASKGARS
ncbi:MAG TPA: hypothetical protein VE650_01100 [Acetobacteraceae bacterium]|nr:hypothetical protein [Acetobacteraceae bacterium]